MFVCGSHSSSSLQITHTHLTWHPREAEEAKRQQEWEVPSLFSSLNIAPSYLYLPSKLTRSLALFLSFSFPLQEEQRRQEEEAKNYRERHNARIAALSSARREEEERKFRAEEEEREKERKEVEGVEELAFLILFDVVLDFVISFTFFSFINNHFILF